MWTTLNRQREELVELLAEMYAIGRLSEEAYERLTSAAYSVADSNQLVRLVEAIGRKLGPQEPPSRPARPGAQAAASPEAEIARLVGAFYQAISWQCDHGPSLEAVLDLIDPKAQFFQGDDSMDARSFWSRRVEFWTRCTALPFFQRETSERTLVFGDLGHRLSCFEAIVASGKLVGRGLNSFQLCRGRNRWRIVGVAWDEQRDGLILPEL